MTALETGKFGLESWQKQDIFSLSNVHTGIGPTLSFLFQQVLANLLPLKNGRDVRLTTHYTESHCRSLQYSAYCVCVCVFVCPSSPNLTEVNILHTTKRRKVNWIGHILRGNCLLKDVIEGKLEERIQMTGRWGRRCNQLLDDVKEKTGCWKLKEEALDRTVWRTRFGRGCAPAVRQYTERWRLL
jgi:hypothetical protein